MNPETIFTIANLLPMPIWAVWVLAPRTALARRLAESVWPWAILAALYTVLLATALAGGGMGGEGSFSSLAGVMALFDSPWGTLAGWVHYLCFDLFVARWIVHDAPEAGYKLSPILVLTMVAGPFGLLVYLGARRWLRTVPAAAGPC